MFRLNIFSSTFLLSVLIALVSPLEADDRPVPPADPKSQEECRAYQRQVMDYADVAVEKSRECSAKHRAANNEEIVLYQPSSGGDVLSAFKSCTGFTEAAWCTLAGVSEKVSACFEKATAAEQKRLTNALARNDEHRENETEKLQQGQSAAAEGGPAARGDAEAQTALTAEVTHDASPTKPAADAAASSAALSRAANVSITEIRLSTEAVGRSVARTRKTRFITALSVVAVDLTVSV